MTRAVVFGSGSWGTAFAAILADAGAEVTMHARRPEVAQAINTEHVNAAYLPDLVLPETVRATNDPAQAADGADLVVLAIPSQTLRANLADWGQHLPPGVPVVSLMKGIELGTGQRMSEVISEAGGVASDQVVVVSGPNLSKEIAAKQPAAAVVACTEESTAETVARACATAYFRPYTQTDVIGAELGGAIKNVIALAVGMAGGLGYGDNTKATIITRGLAETARLGSALGADPATLMGLAGVGDLIATCMSPLSRNHAFGRNLGTGMSVEEVVAITSQTAEGVKSCRPIVDLASRHGVDMPICAAVTAVVEHAMDVREMGEALMSRPHKHERH